MLNTECYEGLLKSATRVWKIKFVYLVLIFFNLEIVKFGNMLQ